MQRLQVHNVNFPGGPETAAKVPLSFPEDEAVRYFKKIVSYSDACICMCVCVYVCVCVCVCVRVYTRWIHTDSCMALG